jgi:hypothetical protein
MGFCIFLTTPNSLLGERRSLTSFLSGPGTLRLLFREVDSRCAVTDLKIISGPILIDFGPGFDKSWRSRQQRAPTEIIPDVESPRRPVTIDTAFGHFWHLLWLYICNIQIRQAVGKFDSRLLHPVNHCVQREFPTRRMCFAASVDFSVTISEYLTAAMSGAKLSWG